MKLQKQNFYLIIGIIILVFTLNLARKEYVLSVKKKEEKKFDLQIRECETLLNNRVFGSAKICFSELEKKYPNNIFIKYYNGVSYFFARKIEEAEAEFNYVLENETKNQRIINETKNYLNKLQEMKRLRRHDIGHYFAELDSVAKWQNPKNIKVYIADEYKKGDLLKQAFEKWDSALYDTVNFKYVDNPQKADIVVSATKRAEVLQYNKNAVGITNSATMFLKNNPKKQYFVNAEIKISINYDDKYLIDDKTFVGIALHEIGHALGIVSHSPSIGDVMYYSTDSYATDTITKRDINTVKRIYGNIL